MRRAVTDAQATARAVEAQYRTGFVAQTSLIDAQVAVLRAREQLVASDAQLRQDSAALFKAIGGGWEDAAAG
ncbi:TolC family protein [Pseudomonas sp. JAI120]|uniref:TolC family protein n=1 Tax=Pseudomonas sp. JAI120 TaxID=2723063 RepID=UPI0030EDE4FA